jgi:CheY-like chemotaxis protein
MTKPAGYIGSPAAPSPNRAARASATLKARGLKNASILVVEDEALIAMDLQSILEDAGFHVLGPIGTISKAFAFLERSTPDLALLDVNLGGVDVFALADALASRGIKFIFLTGHSARRLPEGHRHRTLVSKPFLPGTVLDAIQLELATAKAQQPE